MIDGLDVSQWNGTINWPQVTEQFVFVKMGGGDAGLYLDSMATKNYYGAKAAGKIVGGYWFAGGTDPIKEADYFVRAMSPIAPGDLFALDWEISHINPVQWCLQFVTEVHTKTGVWPWLYINASTCNAYDWSPILANCGLWVADYAVSPTVNVPIKYTYIAQQYTDTPYDKDKFFGSIDELKAYGYKVPVATPAASPAPSAPPVAPSSPTPTAPTTVLSKIGTTLPTASPTPVPTPAPTVITPVITSTKTPVPVVVDKSTKPNLLKRFWAWLEKEF